MLTTLPAASLLSPTPALLMAASRAPAPRYARRLIDSGVSCNAAGQESPLAALVENLSRDPLNSELVQLVVDRADVSREPIADSLAELLDLHVKAVVRLPRATMFQVDRRLGDLTLRGRDRLLWRWLCSVCCIAAVLLRRLATQHDPKFTESNVHFCILAGNFVSGVKAFMELHPLFQLLYFSASLIWPQLIHERFDRGVGLSIMAAGALALLVLYVFHVVETVHERPQHFWRVQLQRDCRFWGHASIIVTGYHVMASISSWMGWKVRAF
jgi:hypothetical protein